MPPPYRTTTASRERNRVHAQKTRLRKKEQMQLLQSRASVLKEEQVRLKQIINEKSTANILIRLFAEGASANADVTSCDSEDPQVEELLRRPLDDIPDASKIPELPALILPGQHASKKMKASAHQQTLESNLGSGELPIDGIDYELLGRDRMQCTPEELDLIRRERNRMHAKRTRDRKRIFTEKLAELCRELEEQNTLLHTHLMKIDPEYEFQSSQPSASTTSSLSGSSQSSPEMQPSHSDLDDMPTMRLNAANVVKAKVHQVSYSSTKTSKRIKHTDGLCDHEHMILTLLKAAEQELHEVSDGGSSAYDDEVHAPSKRQRILASLTVS
jgi:Basic region leucine zipper